MTRQCIICSEADTSEHYCNYDDGLYLKCSHCGLIYIDVLQEADKLYSAYNGGFFKDLRRKLTMPLRKIEGVKNFATSLQRAQGIIEFCSSQVAAKEKLKFFDVGCNKGFLLLAGLQRGWDVYGEELIPELIRPLLNSRPELKGHVYSGRFCDVEKNLESNSFDLISAIDVVEHFENPLSDLKAIRRILSENGRVVMQTPDISCQRAVNDGCEWGALKPMEHLHLFDASNFAMLAKKAGFSKVECFPAFEEADGNFVVVLRK